MRALTLSQPWASLVASGAKRIETRPWRANCEYYGWLAIHAAAPPWRGPVDGVPMDDLPPPWERAVSLAVRGALGVTVDDDLPTLPHRAVVAVARLDRCLPVGRLQLDEIETPRVRNAEDDHIGPYAWTERHLGDYRLGRWAWLLPDVVALPEPVPVRGQHGVWRVPDDVAAAVAAQADLEPEEHS